MTLSRHDEIYATLATLYPEPRSELHYTNPFELLIAVVLSAQCTDKKVNEVTPILFSTFSTPRDLSQAAVTEIEKIIRPINYYRTKARHIVAAAQLLVTHHRGEVPLTFEALTQLPGVGRKTANVVLGELGATKTLPVDTHVLRLARRLGLSRGKTPLAIESSLRGRFPPQQWRTLHHTLILHGRRVCKARRPSCSTCGLYSLCRSPERKLTYSGKK